MLKYYVMLIEEFSGLDCDGHWVLHICAAESLEQAEELLAPTLPLDRYTKPQELPPLTKKIKPHILYFRESSITEVPAHKDP